MTDHGRRPGFISTSALIFVFNLGGCESSMNNYYEVIKRFHFYRRSGVGTSNRSRGTVSPDFEASGIVVHKGDDKTATPMMVLYGVTDHGMIPSEWKGCG
jgi:hypothetical protein